MSAVGGTAENTGSLRALRFLTRLRHADCIQRSDGSSSNHSALVQITRLKLVRRQMTVAGKSIFFRLD